jgi:hypothetical protein
MKSDNHIKDDNKGDYSTVAPAGQPKDLRVSPCNSYYEVEVTGGHIMEGTVEYNIAEEPLVIGKPTMDRILKECKKPADCIALYTFYYYTAKWQGTNKPKATVSFCAVGLDLSEDRVRKAKKELIKAGLISDFKRVDAESGKVLGWYVLVKYVHFKFHPTEFPHSGFSHTVDEQEANALSTGSLNALNTNKVNPLAPEDKESCIQSKKTDGAKAKPPRKFVAPNIQEVQEWAREWAKGKNKNPSTAVKIAVEAWNYYDRLDWHDAKGAKIRSWKMKIIAVWFTDEKFSKFANGVTKIEIY